MFTIIETIAGICALVVGVAVAITQITNLLKQHGMRKE